MSLMIPALALDVLRDELNARIVQLEQQLAAANALRIPGRRANAAGLQPWAMTREQLILRIVELENKLAVANRHGAKGVGELTAAVAKTAITTERRRIAERLRAEARSRSRKLAGPLRIVANMIEEAA